MRATSVPTMGVHKPIVRRIPALARSTERIAIKVGGPLNR